MGTKKSDVYDLTDQFDTRLAAMEKRRVPRDEVDSAITVYERVATARAICQALLGPGFTPHDVVALAVEIGGVKQSGQFVTSRE